MTAERERKLEQALEQFLRPIRGIPFEVVIQALCGVSLLPFDRQVHGDLLNRIAAAMDGAVLKVRAAPIRRSRPNEVGNDMEPFVIAALREQGLIAAAPRTRGGRGKSTGYPDIRVKTDGPPVFLEVKTYAAKNRATTQRSFYISPGEDPKVHEDGFHLLAGFEMQRDGDAFVPVAWELADLYGLDCDMKAEFNSDNRRLYSEGRLLASGRV